MKNITYAIIAVMIVLIVFLFAQEVNASSGSHTYTMTHSLEMELDGDFEFRSIVGTPSQGTIDTELKGDGKAKLSTQLEIYEATKISDNWFDIF